MEVLPHRRDVATRPIFKPVQRGVRYEEFRTAPAQYPLYTSTFGSSLVSLLSDNHNHSGCPGCKEQLRFSSERLGKNFFLTYSYK